MARVHAAADMASASVDLSLLPAVHASENEWSRVPQFINQPLPANGTDSAPPPAMSVHVQQAVFNGDFSQPPKYAGPSFPPAFQSRPLFGPNGNISASANVYQVRVPDMGRNVRPYRPVISQGSTAPPLGHHPARHAQYQGPVGDHGTVAYRQHPPRGSGHQDGFWSDTNRVPHANDQTFSIGFANGQASHIANVSSGYLGHAGHPRGPSTNLGVFRPQLSAQVTQPPFVEPAAPIAQPALASRPPVQKLSIEIVIENPMEPRPPPSKGRRTIAESDQQMQESIALRHNGGACLWCYRSKKKCGAGKPCPTCEASKRQCIRDVIEFCFLCSDRQPALFGQHAHDESRLFRTAMQMVHDLRDTIVNDSLGQRWVVTFRGQEAAKESVWITDLASLSKWSGTADEVKHILSVSLPLVSGPELPYIEAQWLKHELLATAVTMCKSLGFILSLSRARVFASSADRVKSLLVVLHLLTVQTQILCQKSAEFCTNLFEAIRARDTSDDFTNNKDSASSLPTNNPIWVAIAIYYRVVERLLDAEREPLVALVQDKLIPRLHEIKPLTWAAVKIIPSGLMTAREFTTLKFDGQMPPLAESKALGISFCIDTKEEGPGDSIQEPQRPDLFLKSSSWEVVDLFKELTNATSEIPANASASDIDGAVPIKTEESAMELEQPSQSSPANCACTSSSFNDQPEHGPVFDGLPDISSFGNWDGTVCEPLSDETSWTISESDDRMFQSPMFGSQMGVNPGTLDYRDFLLYPQPSA